MGEAYVIDLTAAQFGWKETLAPWDEWIALRTTWTVAQPYHVNMGRLNLKTRALKTYLGYHQEAFRKHLMTDFGRQFLVYARTVGGFNPRSFDTVLKLDPENYAQVKNEWEMMLHQEVIKNRNDIFWKDTFRLFMSFPPTYRVMMAGDFAPLLKDGM